MDMSKSSTSSDSCGMTALKCSMPSSPSSISKIARDYLSCHNIDGIRLRSGSGGGVSLWKLVIKVPPQPLLDRLRHFHQIFVLGVACFVYLKLSCQILTPPLLLGMISTLREIRYAILEKTGEDTETHFNRILYAADVKPFLILSHGSLHIKIPIQVQTHGQDETIMFQLPLTHEA